MELGEVPERLNGTVSKTVVGLVSTVGSNPTLSASKSYNVWNWPEYPCNYPVAALERDSCDVRSGAALCAESALADARQ